MKSILLMLGLMLFGSVVFGKSYNVLAFREFPNDDVVLLSDKECNKVSWRAVYKRGNEYATLGCWAHDFYPNKIFIMWDDGVMEEYDLNKFKILRKLK